MKRDVEKELLSGKKKKIGHLLLFVEQGKLARALLIEEFGKEHFQNFLIVNFEEKPEAKSCFESLDVQVILKQLGYPLWNLLVPGTTLLFLDEIQICPQAIKALRYFKEKLPSSSCHCSRIFT